MDRIPLTDENIQNWITSSLSESIPLWNLETNNLVIRGLSLEQAEQLKKQILDDYKKANLFDSLQVENQTILDTISQVKIANKMFAKNEKELKEDLKHFKTAFTKSEGERIGYKLKLKKILGEP